eukprot:scaffold167698_cov31-Tisochrysis_lutea.AAC.2
MLSDETATSATRSGSHENRAVGPYSPPGAAAGPSHMSMQHRVAKIHNASHLAGAHASKALPGA